MLTIIITIAVLAFVISRFLSFNLPKSDKPSSPNDWQNLFGREGTPMMKDITQTAVVKTTTPKPTVNIDSLEGTAKLKALDDNFSEKKFLEGLKTAYTYFCESWNNADFEALDNLTGPTLLKQLKENTLGLPTTMANTQLASASIEQVRINGRSAVIDATLIPQQNGEEKGLPPMRWTLARALGSEDPNWELQAIVLQEKAE